MRETQDRTPEQGGTGLEAHDAPSTDAYHRSGAPHAPDVRRAARDARAASRAVTDYGRQVRARSIAAREQALRLRVHMREDGSETAACRHQWGAWQLQATWIATSDRPEERAWHRGCTICFVEEYLRKPGTTRPAEQAPVEGWLFKP